MSIVDSNKYAAPKPSKITLFFRTCVLWQLLRFLVLNLKMTIMIVKSHGKKIKKVEKSLKDDVM